MNKNQYIAVSGLFFGISLWTGATALENNNTAIQLEIEAQSLEDRYRYEQAASVSDQAGDSRILSYFLAGSTAVNLTLAGMVAVSASTAGRRQE